VRDIRDPNLLEVWKAALEALRMAERWIIVGYSMPPEDVAIRSLFLRAWQGRRYSKKPLIRVIQAPQLKASTEPSLTEMNYRLAFGDCSYEPIGIEGLIGLRG